jgi:hypothetical protein
MKQRETYVLLISALILVVFWIGFSIYHGSVTSTIPATLNIQIIPINPAFDTKTISDIKTRPEVTPLYQLEQSSVEPEPAIENPTTLPTPAATAGGTLQ